VLSMIGLYGVMSYLVAQRTREFGIRLALGATRTGIVSVVLRHGAKLIAIGAVLGAIGTIGLSKLMEGLLYGIEPFDASAFVAMGMLIAVALLACAIPALRATRVDPVVALRSE
jgi:ABC-type antimicrobial peptide transport system permease subunit